MKKDSYQKTQMWSLFDHNFHRQAMNMLPGQNLTEIARPWFHDYLRDPRVEAALKDLNETGRKQRRALAYLGLDLIPAAA